MSFLSLDLPQYAMFAVALLIVLGLIFLLTWILRRIGGVNGGQTPFSRRERRLKVLEGTTIGNRHKLVLVQRDNVEHLLLIGGATDLVVEHSITPGGALPAAAAPTPHAPPPQPATHIEPRFTGRAAGAVPTATDDTGRKEPSVAPKPAPTADDD